MDYDVFQPDFFNDVAAVCVVVLFAKFVTHRTGRRRTSSLCRYVWHALCMIFATGGLLVALLAVHWQSNSSKLYSLAWAFLGASCLILLGDVLIEDWFGRKSQDEQ